MELARNPERKPSLKERTCHPMLKDDRISVLLGWCFAKYTEKKLELYLATARVSFLFNFFF